MLYQRYFLKMNQSNMTNLIFLLLLLCSAFLIVAATDFFVVPNRTDNETDILVETTGSSYKDKLLMLMCTSLCCIAVYGGKKIKNDLILNCFN